MIFFSGVSAWENIPQYKKKIGPETGKRLKKVYEEVRAVKNLKEFFFKRIIKQLLNRE